MGTHTATELGGTALRAPTSVGQFWSLAVLLEPAWRDQALATLHEHQPFAIGRPDALGTPANDTERGAISWRHYVFESEAASDQFGQPGEGASGLVNSGVFADGALAEGNPPTKATPRSDERPSDEGQPPSADTRPPEVDLQRSRPESKLQEP